jgi:drug/metabolite transporter (DMT)-like permease
MFTKTDIEKYFTAEKQESLLFILIGLAGVLTAIVFFFFLKTGFYKGAAIPLLLVGLLLAVVGYTVYTRSDDDRKRNVYAYDLNPSDLKQKEIPRMETVMKNFVIYRWVEICLLLAGSALYIYFIRNGNNSFWKGLGIGLASMALIALAADFFAERRGHVYLRGLKAFTASMK